uniref:Uncharacterized protein n=1 Tax=Arundo donax TaxID=35708 RepID=A0A0A9K1S9_ARUDO
MQEYETWGGRGRIQLYACIELFGQTGTTEASPTLGSSINVLISSDGLIPDSLWHSKSLRKKNYTFDGVNGHLEFSRTGG